jgi:hypothetical protein
LVAEQKREEREAARESRQPRKVAEMPDDDAIDEIEQSFEQTAWRLSGYGRSTWATRYSKQHLLDPDTEETLCGAKQGLHFESSHSGRCRRCYVKAARLLTAEGASE